MKHVDKNLSREVGKEAKNLRKGLQLLAATYFDPHEFGPTADLYSEDFKELQKLLDEINWWIG